MVNIYIEPKAIPPVVEAPLFSKTIISFLSFIFSVKKHISLSDWLSPGATLESALRRPKLKSSLPHIHTGARYFLTFVVFPYYLCTAHRTRVKTLDCFALHHK